MKNNSDNNTTTYQQEQANLKILIEQLSTELDLNPLKMTESEFANGILHQLNQLAEQAESSCRFSTLEDLRESLIKLSNIPKFKEISNKIISSLIEFRNILQTQTTSASSLKDHIEQMMHEAANRNTPKGPGSSSR